MRRIKIRPIPNHRVGHRWFNFDQIIRSQLSFQPFDLILKPSNIILHLHETFWFTIFALTFIQSWLFIWFLMVDLNFLRLVQNILSVVSFDWHRVCSGMGWICRLDMFDGGLLVLFLDAFEWIFTRIAQSAGSLRVCTVEN